jgi:RNA polymerase I-specific transcription initiation factor RRN3
MQVLVHVPTSPAAVLQKLAMGVPHKLRDRNVQCLYLTAMFIIAESPGGWPIRDGLLAAALEHILTIDVEIQWKSIEDKPKGKPCCCAELRGGYTGFRPSMPVIPPAT